MTSRQLYMAMMVAAAAGLPLNLHAETEPRSEEHTS